MDKKNLRYSIIEKAMGDDFLFWLFPENIEEKTKMWEKHKDKIHRLNLIRLTKIKVRPVFQKS